jgi:hypothetical protein
MFRSLLKFLDTSQFWLILGKKLCDLHEELQPAQAKKNLIKS